MVLFKKFGCSSCANGSKEVTIIKDFLWDNLLIKLFY